MNDIVPFLSELSHDLPHASNHGSNFLVDVTMKNHPSLCPTINCIPVFLRSIFLRRKHPGKCIIVKHDPRRLRQYEVTALGIVTCQIAHFFFHHHHHAHVPILQNVLLQLMAETPYPLLRYGFLTLDNGEYGTFIWRVFGKQVDEGE